MKYGVVAILFSAVFAVAIVGCSDDDAIDTEAVIGEAVDREVLLNNVDDVRAMVADNAGSLDPAMIADVDYSDGQLRIVLAESQNDLDISGVEAACDQISEAIALPGTKILVETADGSESAECEFGA